MNKGLGINKTDKFRNQRVILTVYVPVGKRIKVDRSFTWSNNVHFGSNWNDDWYYDSEDTYDNWDAGREYIMKADGHLYNLNGKRAGREEDEDDNDGRKGRTKVTINGSGIEVITDDKDDSDNYRYNSGQPAKKIDSLKLKMDEKQRIKDSLFQKAKEKIEKELGKNGGHNQPSGITTLLPALNPLTEVI
jgi:hypothetical protein